MDGILFDIERDVTRQPEHPELTAFGMEGVDTHNLLLSFKNSGLMCTNIYQAYEILQECYDDEDYSVFLSAVTSVFASGTRNVILHLVKAKMIDLLSLSAGAVIEDILACLNCELTGNLTFLRQAYWKQEFDTFMKKLIKSAEQLESHGFHLTPERFLRLAGKLLDNENSVLYEAYKFNIPVFCCGISDGIWADYLAESQLVIDVVGDARALNKCAERTKKLLTIVLGGSYPKHQINKAAIFNGRGADAAVYFCSEEEYTGSDSGAHCREAQACGKLSESAIYVKVSGDASVGFSIVGTEVYNEYKSTERFESKINIWDCEEMYWARIEQENNEKCYIE